MNTPTDIPTDTGWQSIRPGLERRIMPWIDEEGKLLERFYVLRIDPALYRFDVAYRAKNPLTLTEWLAETGALLVINGGYFREENDTYTPTGLAIVEGQRIGTSYGDFAGMLAISEAGPSVRWLREHPYTPDEPLLAALQSFPLLVRPGGILGFSAENEDGRAARRTVLGQDKAGRIVVILAVKGYPTLHQMSRYLTETDFELHIALNLDGGKSSGILLAEPEEGVPALTALPIVITVFPR